MSDTRPRCPHCQGLLKHEPADILGPERVKCILCGWEMVRAKQPGTRPAAEPEPNKAGAASSAPTPIITHKKENTTMGYYGTCTTCNRPKISLQYKDTCKRCHDRIAKGKDPLTGEKIVPATTAPVTPAILADDEPISQETTVQPAPQAIKAGAASSAPTVAPSPLTQAMESAFNGFKLLPPATGFTLDVMAAIDEAWLGKRTAIITQLQAATKTSEKLRIAFFTLASVNSMGTEA